MEIFKILNSHHEENWIWKVELTSEWVSQSHIGWCWIINVLEEHTTLKLVSQEEEPTLHFNMLEYTHMLIYNSLRTALQEQPSVQGFYAQQDDKIRHATKPIKFWEKTNIGNIKYTYQVLHRRAVTRRPNSTFLMFIISLPLARV